MIEKKVRWMLVKVKDYNLEYTYYLGRKDKDGLLGAVTEAIQFDQQKLYDLQGKEKKTI